MKKIMRPKVVIPIILSASIVAALLAFADVKKVLTLLLGFQGQYLLYFFLLMLAYEVVRAAQWHYLLTTLDIRVPLRTQLFTYLAGEMAKSLPVGNYFSSYLLSETKGAKLSRASAATSVVILVEVIVSLLGLIVLGVGDWGWLRPTILIGSFAAVVIGWAILKVHDDVQPPRWMLQREKMRVALRELRTFRDGAAELLRPRVLAVELIFGAIYLVLAGLSLYVVMAGLGIQSASIWQAVAVYFFSLAVGLLIPLPVDIGLIEMGGIGALLALGIDRSAAVGTMFLFRVLTVATALAISLVAMLVLREELRAVLRERTEHPAGQTHQSQDQSPSLPGEAQPDQQQQPPHQKGAA
jgi:glycosyltransferase 2 family protein